MTDTCADPAPVHEGHPLMRLADDVWLEVSPGNPSYGGILHARYHVAEAVCQRLGFRASPHPRKGTPLFVVYLTRAKAARVPGVVRDLGVAGTK